MTDIVKTTKPGVVENIVRSVDPSEPEKAEIHIPEADPLYQELRIPNSLRDARGNEVQVEKDAAVEVHIEAHKDSTTPKK
jgi:hypothetical protein